MEENIPAEVIADDRSAIAKELEQVTDDGRDRKPEGEQAEPEQIQEETPAGEELETHPQDEEVPASPEGETQPAGESTDQIESQPTQEELDDYEREIEAIQAPKGASTRTTEVLKILKEKNKLEHREKKELAKKLEEANSRDYIDEEKAKEIEELRNFRSTFAVQEDLNRKYVPQIQQHEGQAVALMRQHGLPDETAKFLGEQGGLLRVRDSEIRMPVGTQDLDGNPFVGTQADWYRKVVEPLMNESLPNAIKTKINFHLNKAYESLAERDEAFSKARQNPQQYVQSQQEKQQAMIEELRVRADKQLQKESDIYGDISKPKEIPANATKEQVAEINQHNARLEEAKGTIRQLLTDTSPENLVSMATSKAYRDVFFFPRVKAMEAENAKLRAENNEMKSKWAKAKNVAQTTRQQANVSQVNPRSDDKPRGFTSDDDAKGISKLLAEIPA